MSCVGVASVGCLIPNPGDARNPRKKCEPNCQKNVRRSVSRVRFLTPVQTFSPLEVGGCNFKAALALIATVRLVSKVCKTVPRSYAECQRECLAPEVEEGSYFTERRNAE
eukprot:1330909-Amphidinium_carterae.1